MPTGATLLYQPRVLGAAEVLFFDKKRRLSPKQTHRLLAEVADNGTVNWFTAERLTVNPTTSPLPQPSSAPWTCRSTVNWLLWTFSTSSLR